MVTLTSYEVRTFIDRVIASGGDMVEDGILHLSRETGIRPQPILWLYSGYVATVTR